MCITHVSRLCGQNDLKALRRGIFKVKNVQKWGLAIVFSTFTYWKINRGLFSSDLAVIRGHLSISLAVFRGGLQISSLCMGSQFDITRESHVLGSHDVWKLRSRHSCTILCTMLCTSNCYCNICTVLVKTTGHEFIANYITQYVINDNSSSSVLLVMCLDLVR